MAKQARSSGAVTGDRAARLCRLVQMLAKGPQTRDEIMRHLRIDVRSFYRDLVVIRGCGIRLPLRNRRYELKETADEAIGRLPFPDPFLNMSEAIQLAKGRTLVHRKLSQQIGQILKKPARRSRS